MELFKVESSDTTTERDKLLLSVFDYIQKEFPEALEKLAPGQKTKFPVRKFGKLLTNIAGDVIIGETPSIVKIFESIDFYKAIGEVEEIRKNKK